MTENFTDQGQFLSSEDSHYFLTTTVLPGKKDIANLRETNPHHTSFYYVDEKSVFTEQTDPNIVTHRQSKLNSSNLTCIQANDPIRRVISKYQPYMYDTPEIINCYDHAFYRDWRYPERPIDVKFAANPDKYCEQNPQIYPSYKHLSKW
jgi:hypothetical protein